MLTAAAIDRILERLPQLAIGVVGDLFLDQYLDLDASLTEPSLETGRDAYQIVGVRNQPGAAGTVLNNLAALGVGRCRILSVIGRDANGYALKQELAKRGIGTELLLEVEGRHTPTYTKPLLLGQELERLDLKNRTPTPAAAEDRILAALPRLWSEVDALVVLDQVSEAECGVVTSRVRAALADLAASAPKKMLLADSRERIALFKGFWVKPNLRELCRSAVPYCTPVGGLYDVVAGVFGVGWPVFCTCGENGIFVVDPFDVRPWPAHGHVYAHHEHVRVYPVSGPIDTVGAGDSVSAGLACAVAAGATLPEAADFANLVASITIQQLGTTGTASPTQVRARWQESQRAAAAAG